MTSKRNRSKYTEIKGQQIYSDHDSSGGEDNILYDAAVGKVLLSNGVRLAESDNSYSDGEHKPLTSSCAKKERFTVEEAVNQIGYGKFQLMVTFLAGFGIIAEAIEMMILSIISPALLCDWGITSSQQAFITTFVFVGMMFGSAAWGIMCDRYGRKTGVLMSFFITFYFGLLSAYSPNVYWIYILRGIMGFGTIGGSQTNTIQIEFATTNTRVHNMLVMQTFWACGNCFVIVLAITVMPTLGWRWQLTLSALPLLVAFTISLIFLPESARYHVTSGQLGKAMKTLKKMARMNGKAMPKGDIYIPENSCKRGRVADLFSPNYIRTTLMLWYIWFATAFAYYGVSLFATELMKTHTGCPSSADSSSAPACTLECRELQTWDYGMLLIVSSAEFMAVPNSFFWTRFCTRRKTLFIMYTVFTIFVGLLSTCISKIVQTLFIMVIRMFAASIFQIIYLYTLEVYPTAVRAIGLGSCSSAARVGGLITPFIAQVILEKSLYVTVAVYAVIGFVAGITALFLPIETKGKSLNDFTPNSIDK